MVLVEQNIFTKEDLETILGLPEVVASRGTIDERASGSVYFSAALGTSLKQTLYERIGLNLSEVAAVPMRWIKGDIPAHEDKGAGHFENTYLVYLTDSAGELLVDRTAYPISQGSAYVFSEGLRHETVGTGPEPRLLLGPMSESGFAVGAASTIDAAGQTDTIYFSYISGSGLFYRINDNGPYGVSLPITIRNTTPLYTLKVLFETDINIDTNIAYFICGSDNIQFGSETLNPNGSRPTITINDDNYDGLIFNGQETYAGYNDIYVYNLVIDGTGHTLQIGAGWLCQKGFANGATNNYIINCSSTGNLPGGAVGSGGIVGAFAGKDGGSLKLYGCSSSGSMGQLDGGIVGAFAGKNGGSVSCNMCFTTGVIGNFAGGIFGDYAGDSGTVEATKCYTTGTIGGNAGGIYGRYAGNNGSATAQKCYSRGNIGADGGGIYGLGAGSNSGNTTATNCYSAGTITTSGRGIYGSGKSNGTETNCYAAGGSWQNITANTQLQGFPSPIIGTTWVYRGIDEPYELVANGYTPYSVSNITSTPSLNQSYSQTVNAGESTIGGIIAGLSYEILQINGGNGSITINPTTGSISTTSNTTSATYTIYIRNTGSYNITTFTLTVEEAALTCCQRPIYIPNANYTARVNVVAGGVLNADTSIRRGPISYSDMLRIKMALASKR